MGSTFSLIFGAILTVAVPMSMVPLVYNIVKAKSVKGISFFSQTLGNLNTLGACINAVIVNYGFLLTCDDDGFVECLPKIFIVAMAAGNWVMYFIIINLYVYIFRQHFKESQARIAVEAAALNQDVAESLSASAADEENAMVSPVVYSDVAKTKHEREDTDATGLLSDYEQQQKQQKDVDTEGHTHEQHAQKQHQLLQHASRAYFRITKEVNKVTSRFSELQIVYTVYLLYIIFLLASVGATVVILNQLGHASITSQSYAESWGYFVSVIVVIQWTPQIYRTWRSKSAGNFSVLMMCIQAPGTLIVLFFYIVIAKQPYTAWISFVFSGTQQIILLSLLIYYERIAPRIRKYKLEKAEKAAQAESASLLATGSSASSSAYYTTGNSSIYGAA